MKHSLVFLGTYPPRECGIATFTQDLVNSCQKLLDSNVSCKVAALNLSASDSFDYPKEVFWQIEQNEKKSFADLAFQINQDESIEAVIIQHEYGIYGGRDGSNLLLFTKKCKKKKIIAFHTVLENISGNMHQVTKMLIQTCDEVVVLTQISKEILHRSYLEAEGKVRVIQHGIHPMPFVLPQGAKKLLKLENKIVLSTFGFLSPGKGIEYVLDALPQVVKSYPEVLYLILGETHPVIMRKQGETYRKFLMKKVKKLGLSKNVRFFDLYLPLPDLLKYLQATDIYISTSLNPNQAASGTFSYALGAGRAVISTIFKQSEELIGQCCGLLVPPGKPKAFQNAILTLLDNSKLRIRLHYDSYDKTRSMLWSNVAHDYLLSTEKLTGSNFILPPLNLIHLRKMTDKLGLFQFANKAVPDPEFGYTIDDNARALVYCNQLYQNNKNREIARLIKIYLNFVQGCQHGDGTFYNFLDKHGVVLDDKNDKRQGDAYGRTMWGLASTITNSKLDTKLKSLALSIWIKAFPHMEGVTNLRSRAHCLLGLCLAYKKMPVPQIEHLINYHAKAIADSFFKHSKARWRWFEDQLTYANGLLPQSLLESYLVTHNKQYKDVGLSSLSFLTGKTFYGKIYVPIGQRQWHKKGGKRSYFDQQPEDPCAMILALGSAFKVTQSNHFIQLAQKCYSWFLGNNITGTTMYDNFDGGCLDGLTSKGVNMNKGAESLLSHLIAHDELENILNETRVDYSNFSLHASPAFQFRGMERWK
ncbi:MAG: Glycosyl transferase group 1 [Candidatus Woesebacteria bacterium GW2011_GWB1_38_5b]|uniref:Glycosyl transferase group 1 n=1 Tax=Candidatus Woesebacteria bacterium GW2011_GWB1_38_5b TaxID=1618569 RepID=A0A0G0K7P5_9BACT|nr:MAG: Glycosyl transferase group 1 [Candidatus Woesebacteria bacterium GW2011_GWB1_38_5b]